MQLPQPVQFIGRMPVMVSPEFPKLKIREHVPMTDAYRAEVNAWLLSMFGTTSTMKDGEIYKLNLGRLSVFETGDKEVLVMNQNTYGRMKAVADTR